MTKIKKYDLDQEITGEEKLLMTDGDTSRTTKNISVEDFVSWIGDNIDIEGSDSFPILAYPVENDYADGAAMVADQVSQTEDYFQYVADTDTYYQYLGTTDGSLADYRPLNVTETKIIQGRNYFSEVIPDNYLGRRYKFTDPGVNGFFFGTVQNKRTGITVWNSSTGTSATSSFVVSDQNSAFGNALSMQYFGQNYFGVPLRNSGGLYSNTKMTFTLANAGSFEVYSLPNVSLGSMNQTPVFSFSPTDMAWLAKRTTTSNIDNAHVRALVTKEWIQDKYGTSGASGLEAIDEGNGVGWRLIGRDSANHGNIGLNAIDLSASNSPGSNGAVGDYSFSVGLNNTVNGDHGVAFGEENIVQGSYSLAFGYDNSILGSGETLSGAFGMENIVSDSVAFAFGRKNNVSDPYSMASGSLNTITQSFGHAFGGGLVANDYMTIAVGKANLNTTATGATGGNSLNYNDSKLFVVGNGTIGGGSPVTVLTRSDAFVVYQGGEVTLPSLSNALIDSSGNDIAVTKGWVEEKNNKTEVYTFATLPAAPVQGQRAAITDASTVSFRAPALGGGADFSPVIYDGSQWIYA